MSLQRGLHNNTLMRNWNISTKAPTTSKFHNSRKIALENKWKLVTDDSITT